METAQAYLKAAWMAEDETNIDSGNRFREHAKAYFAKALENHEVEEEKLSGNYLSGWGTQQAIREI